MSGSLSARLLTAVSVVLLIFFGATVVVLDSAFRLAAERAVEDRLDVQIFLLLAEAEPLPTGALALSDELPEPRFSTPGSGLYAQVNDASGSEVWRSASAVGFTLPLPAAGGAVGEYIFERVVLQNREAVFLETLMVEWEFEDGTTARYQFGVAESLEPYLGQVRRFRHQLFGWFAGLAAALVVTLGLLLRWVLSPLRKIEREIGEVEMGDRSRLSDRYPTELLGVTSNTNRLIEAERSRLERYRNTLGNLAHALKTPLAVIRTALDDAGPRDEAEIGRQVARIDEIISYQLNRAAASGGVTLGHEPIALTDVLPGLVRTLDKVYAEKHPLVHLAVDDSARFRGDEGDLIEIVGNLLDNAYKYCNEQVYVTARPWQGPQRQSRPGLEIIIEDDGRGIDPEQAGRVLERGVRIDERADGHGIGLAVVREIVAVAGGQLAINASEHGGARVTVRFP